MAGFKTGVKVVLGGFVTVVALGVGCVALIGNSVDEVEKTKTVEVKTEKGETKQVKVNPVTSENYEKIAQGDMITGEGGTTKEEIIALLGKPQTTSESQVNEYKTEFLSWSSVKSGVNISVTITNGKVSSKSLVKI